MPRAARINVRGLERACDRLDLLGFRAYEQREALTQAARMAPTYMRPRWKDRTGDLSASLSKPANQHVYRQSYTIVSDVFYAPFVFRGTEHAPKARKPTIRRKALVLDAQTRVANALTRQ